MRKHVLYTFDDDDPPSLMTSHISELHSFAKSHRTDEERQIGEERGKAAQAFKEDPNYQKVRSFGRVLAGGFTETDIRNMIAYTYVLIARAEDRVAELRDARAAPGITDFYRKAFDGQIDSMESTIKRMRQIIGNFAADVFEAMDTAAISDRHP